VAQEWKRRRAEVWVVDLARYAEVLGGCYIATDADRVDRAALGEALSHLDNLPGTDGCVTATFSRDARFFQPHNAQRIDAIRDEIQRHWAGDPLEAALLTSLIEAADRVDSTTGLHGVPQAVGGPVAPALPEVDLAYLDPPYNQHRYFTNYHIWETLVAWDAPVHYGVACKRVDARDPDTRSRFNERRGMGDALAGVIRDVDAEVVAVSYNDESWVTIEELQAMVGERGGDVCTLAFDSRRYVGAQIGIHNPKGEKVGTVSHLRNLEYVVVGGPASKVQPVADRFGTEGVPQWKSAATSRS
jgi:adenine-specific DNA-methyltransferase